MTGTRTRFDPGAVLFEPDGEILAVGPAPAVEADPRAAAAQVVDANRPGGAPRLPQLPHALGAAAGDGRVDVAMGLAAFFRRSGPPGPHPGDRGGGVASVLCRVRSRRHHLGYGYVAVHGGLGRGRRTDRPAGHARAVCRRRRGLRLFRVHRVKPAAARRDRLPQGRSSQGLGRPGAPPLLHRVLLRRRRRDGGGVRLRDPHPLVGNDVGGAGVAPALGPPAPGGHARPGRPRPGHRGGPLRVARRPRDTRSWPRPARRWPTARAPT